MLHLAACWPKLTPLVYHASEYARRLAVKIGVGSMSFSCVMFGQHKIISGNAQYVLARTPQES